MQSLTSAVRARPLSALLVVGLVLLFGWMFTHLDNGNQWDNDEGIVAMDGWAMLNGYQPYVDFWHDHPPGAPAALALAFRVGGASVPTARGFSLLMGILGMLAVADIAKRLMGSVAGLAAAVLLLLSPHFFWLARSINRDVPSMALGTLGLAILWRWRDVGGRRKLVAGGVALGLGLSFKLSVGLLFVPAGLLLLHGWWRRLAAAGNRRDLARGGALDLAALAAGILGVVSLWALAAPPAAIWQGAIGELRQARDVFPDRAGEYATWLVQENLLDQNLGLVALAAFGFAWLLRQRRSDAVVLGVWLLATCLAIVQQRPMWPKHHFSFVLWPLAVLAGTGVAALLIVARERHTRSLRPWLLAGAVCALVWFITLPRTAAALWTSANDRPFSAGVDGVRWLEANTSPGDEIISDNGLLALRTGRKMDPNMIGMSTKRIMLDELTDAEIIEAAEGGPAKAVLLWNNQLSDFKGFMDWLPTRYVLAKRVGDDRQIWQLADTRLMATPDGIRYGDVALLEGHTVGSTTAHPGDTVALTLVWQALRRTAQPVSAFVHLVGPDGQPVAQQDDWPGANTAEWQAGHLSLDTRTATLPPDTAPGEYRFVIGLYDPTTGERLPALLPDGSRAPGDAVGVEPPVVVTQR